jgi:hypothetical protein
MSVWPAPELRLRLLVTLSCERQELLPHAPQIGLVGDESGVRAPDLLDDLAADACQVMSGLDDGSPGTLASRLPEVKKRNRRGDRRAETPVAVVSLPVHPRFRTEERRQVCQGALGGEGLELVPSCPDLRPMLESDRHPSRFGHGQVLPRVPGGDFPAEVAGGLAYEAREAKLLLLELQAAVDDLGLELRPLRVEAQNIEARPLADLEPVARELEDALDDPEPLLEDLELGLQGLHRGVAELHLRHEVQHSRHRVRRGGT